MHTEDNYAQELVSKWSALGHLTHVRLDDVMRVAARLEGAHRRTMGTRPEKGALEAELMRLRQEGLMGPSTELEQRHAVRSDPWSDKSGPRQRPRGSSYFRQENRTSRSQRSGTGTRAHTVTG